MFSHPLNSEAGQQAMERARTEPVAIASSRAAKARRYEQLITDLQNTDTPTFIEQLINVLQEQSLEADRQLHNAWQMGNYKLFDSLLRTAHSQHLHLIAEANV